MSFKRNNMDEDNDNDSPFSKRQRFDNNDFRGGRGRGRDSRGRGRGDRGGFGGGFRGRGRGGFNRFDRDDRDDNDNEYRGRGGGGFRSRGGGGRGFFGRGDRGGGRGRGRGFGGRNDGGNGGRFEQRETFIKVGQVAPSFENILNDKSKATSLQQYQGKYVALFIFFKDGTFGCTEQQKAFRDAKNDFDKHNAVIVGVSRDSVQSHQRAIEENQLNYTLLADTEGAISKAYGALDNDRVTRSTFLISPNGKIVAVWGKVFGFDKHPRDVAQKLEEIATGKASDDDNDNDEEEPKAKHSDENEENDNEDGNDDNEDNEDDNGDEDE